MLKDFFVYQALIFLFFSAYISSQQVDDLKGMLDDGDCHQLLAIVASMHHEGVGETLHHRALHRQAIKTNMGAVKLLAATWQF